MDRTSMLGIDDRSVDEFGDDRFETLLQIKVGASGRADQVVLDKGTMAEMCVGSVMYSTWRYEAWEGLIREGVGVQRGGSSRKVVTVGG